MKRFLLGILVVLAPLVLLGTLTTKNNANPGGCMQGVTTEVGDEEYITAGGKVLSVQFEPDEAGAATVAEITLYACTDQNATSCVLYLFDSDFDLVPDTSILDGVSLGQRGVYGIQIAGFLRVYTSTAPAADTEIARWWVCGIGTSE